MAPVATALRGAPWRKNPRDLRGILKHMLAPFSAFPAPPENKRDSAVNSDNGNPGIMSRQFNHICGNVQRKGDKPVHHGTRNHHPERIARTTQGTCIDDQKHLDKNIKCGKTQHEHAHRPSFRKNRKRLRRRLRRIGLENIRKHSRQKDEKHPDNRRIAPSQAEPRLSRPVCGSAIFSAHITPHETC